MSKASIILKDAVILLAGSTFFVYVINAAFSPLEKEAARENDPIITAIVQGNAKAVGQLVENGARTDKTDEFGRTALMRVGYANYSEAKLTSDTDAKRAPMVGILVQKGAQVDARDHDGWTPLMWAAWSGMPHVAEALLKLRAKSGIADRRGNTALTIAAQRGNAEIVKLLLAAGADRTATTQDGQTALQMARLGLGQYPAKKAAYDAIVARLE